MSLTFDPSQPKLLLLIFFFFLFVSQWPWIDNKFPNSQLWKFAFQNPLQGLAGMLLMGLQSVLVFHFLSWGVDLELAPIRSTFQSRLGDTLNNPCRTSVLPNALGGTRNEFHELLMRIWNRAFNNPCTCLFSGWNSHSKGRQERGCPHWEAPWVITNKIKRWEIQGQNTS